MAFVVTVKERREYAGVNKRSFAGMGKRWEIEHREVCANAREAAEYAFNILEAHPDRMVTLVVARS